jgi:hypothetical protein
MWVIATATAKAALRAMALGDCGGYIANLTHVALDL